MLGITADPRLLPSPRWPDALPWWRRRMSHALVIGGTGMLRGVALSLASTTDTVSVVARNSTRLEALARQCRALRKPAHLNTLPADYTKTGDLTRALQATVADFGPVTLCIAWIHATAPGALGAAAGALARSGPVRLFHIVGSTAADPARPAPADDAVRAIPNIRYRRIILGFIVEPAGRSRWLTNTEIAAGITRAIELDDPETTIGTTTPWSARPT